MRPLTIARFLLASALSIAIGCTADGSFGDAPGDGQGGGDADGAGGGGGGSSGNGGVEPGHGDDTPVGPSTGEAGDCPAGALGSILELKDLEGTVERIDPEDPGSQAVRTLSGRFGEVDSIEVQLYDGYGAFSESSAAPGSYPIDGADADPAQCGVCVYLYLSQGDAVHTYLATSGLVELESVDGNLTGSAVSLELEELATFTSLEPDGCEASIDDISFDAPLATQG